MLGVLGCVSICSVLGESERCRSAMFMSSRQEQVVVLSKGGERMMNDPSISPELALLCGDSMVCIISLMLHSSAFSWLCSVVSSSSSLILARMFCRTEVLVLPGRSLQLEQCSRVPGQSIAQLGQVQGRDSHSSGCLVRWLVMALATVVSSQMCGVDIMAPVVNWWGSPSSQEYRFPAIF